MRDERQHFSLRKLSVGLASVLIGITFLQNGQTAKADTISDHSNQSAVVQDSNQTANADKNAQNVAVSVDHNANNLDSESANKAIQTNNVAQSDVQVNTQNAEQTRAQINQSVQKSAPNVAPQSAQNNVSIEPANSNTVTTTTFALNKNAKAFFANELKSSKIETQAADLNSDLATQTDPSKLSADNFASGTHWTPAGWTRTPSDTKVAKKSEITFKLKDGYKDYDVTESHDFALRDAKLTATIDKNDMKAGNKILLSAIQCVYNDKQQNQPMIIYMQGTNLTIGGNRVLLNDTNDIGYISYDTPSTNDLQEADVYLNVTKTLDNLATDPSFEFTFSGGTGDFLRFGPNAVGEYGTDNADSANNIGKTAYFVTNSNITPIQITALQQIQGHDLPDNSIDNKSTMVSRDANDLENNWDNINPNIPLTGIQKVQFSNNLNSNYLPDLQIETVYNTVYNNKFYDGNPSNWDWNPNWHATNLLSSKKLDDNLTMNDIQKQTGLNQVTVSYQGNNSAIIAYNIDPKILSAGGETYTQGVTNQGMAINFNHDMHANKDQAMKETLDYYAKRNYIPSSASLKIYFNYLNNVAPESMTSIDLAGTARNKTSTWNRVHNGSSGQSELLRNTMVNYLDDETGTIVNKDFIQGRFNHTTDYTVNIPQKYVLSTNIDSTNYKWSPDKKTITYTFQDDQKANDNDPIVIHLKHKHETVVGSKGDTIDLYQTHTRTVHYVYDDGSKAGDDNVQSVIFTRSADKDLATGKLSNFTPWVADDSYSQINVPIIHGYTPSQTVVQEQTASPDHDVVLTVTYNKNKQQINVSYVDDTTGATLDTKRLDGYSGEDAQYSTKSAIDNYKSSGYELVSDPSNGAELIFDKDDFANNQEVTVHLKHATEQNNLTHNITRTIHYVYADGTKAHDDSQISTTFNGVETIDRVTGKTVSTVWTPETHNFSEVASPLIPGYTANKTLIEDSTVTPTSDNIVQTVTYNPNKQNIHVTFIDDTTGNTLNSVEKSGYTGTDSGYSTKDDIDALIAKGYKLVSDGTPKDHATLMFDSDDFTDDQNFTVHMEHDTQDNNLSREVSRTIHYVYRDGKPAQADKTDSVQFTGVEKIDKVDDHVISTVWTPENKEFSSIATPSLNGYTPDKFGVDSVTVKPNSDNITITVTYNPDTQYSKFNYIDDTTGDELTQETSHGVTGARDNYSTANLISYYKNKGYDLASDDTQGKTLTFDNDDNTDQVYNIHFAHGIITIDPQNPGKPGEKLNPQDPSSPVYPDGSDNLTKNVEREIDYVYTDGRTAQPSIKDSLTFNNTEKIDRVTGTAISSVWDGPKDFADIATPMIEGYTPDKSLVENKGVNHDSDPIKVVITYSADPQHMGVIYRDLTDNRVLSQFAKDGVSDEDSHYNTKSAIDGYLADGYVLSSDSTNGKDLIFDHNDKLDQTYYVDFIHGTHIYNPEKPNVKDKVNKSDYLADYNTVISYVDSSNKKLSQDKMVTDEYKRDLTVDSVNGNIIKRGNWKLNKGYVLVENPVITGYITNATSVKPQDMQKNQTINVVYQTLGKIHLVDNKGHEITKAFSYTNNPTDPTKVLVTKVPSDAGYEQVTFSDDPRSMPTKDTTVVFNAPAQVVINYVDSVTNKTIHADTVTGFATHTSDYATKTEIADLVKHGYVLIHDNVPTSIKLTEDPQNYTVTFVHGISKISHDNPQKEGTPIPNTDQKLPKGVDHDDLNRETVRTITVIDPHTGNKVTKQTAKLFRDATVDNVTGTVIYTDWNKASWDEFDAPTVAGYTPSVKSVVKTPVDISTKPVTVDITYTANPQTGKISYVDIDGKEVANTPLNGKTDEKVSVNPVIPHGWVVVDGQTIPTSVVARPDGIPTVTIKIKHGTVEVTPDKPKTPNDKMPDGDNYPDGVTSSDLNREITRTINVVDPHSGLKTTVQTTHLTRNAVIDLVTKAITYGKWDAGSWDEFDAPTVAGYTPSVKSVVKTPVDISTKPVTVDITYTANPQKGKISYIDENGKEVGTTDLNGKTDEDVKVIPVIPHGWVIVDGQTIPTTVKATADGIPTVPIKIKHGQLVVTPDKPHKSDDKMPDGDNYPKGVSESDLNRNVTRTIVLHEPQGDKTVNQVAKYTRVATIDLVTGKVTYTDWATKHGWDEYVPEAVDGYDPSIKKLDAVAKPDKDTKVEINYMAIPSNDDSSNGAPATPAQPITPSKPTEPNVPNVPDKPTKPAKKSKKPAQSNKLRKQTGKNSAKRNSNNGIKLTPTSATITANNGARNGAKLDSNWQKGTTSSVNNTNLNANSISNVANNASQLPQTGSENDQTATLAGILLASMGIATAIGVSRKKRS